MRLEEGKVKGENGPTWTLRSLVARHLAHSSLVLHGSFKLSSIFVILLLCFPLEWLRQSITTLAARTWQGSEWSALQVASARPRKGKSGAVSLGTFHYQFF
jgi:hypothetical protein